MSIDLMWACSQSRKLGADLIFTCQHVAQLDAFLRRITDWIWRVKAIPHPSIERREAGKRPWLFMASRWRPADIDTEKPEKRLSRVSWWGGLLYRREWEELYDTDELVRPPAALRGRTPRGRTVRGALSSPQLMGDQHYGDSVATATAERHGPIGPSLSPVRGLTSGE
jgi:hypothetical protein